MAILEPFALAIGFLLSYVYDFTLSYGFAIAILTVIINVIIFPLTLRQTRSTKRMQDAQSDIKKLQKKHKDNKEELNKAMAAMYKEKGINPLGCILPLIIQMPIWFALFRVLRDPLNFIPSSSVLFKDLEISTSLTFFNMDLQIPPSEVSEWIDRIPYLVLILLVILTALYQQQQITKKSGKSDNPQAQQMQMVGKVMPLFFGFISWTLPTGLVVYFLTGNIFRIGQQGLIVRLDGREEVKSEEKKEESSENTETNPIQENTRKNCKKKRRKTCRDG